MAEKKPEVKIDAQTFRTMEAFREGRTEGDVRDLSKRPKKGKKRGR